MGRPQTCSHTFFVYSSYIFLRLHGDYLVIFCSDCVSGLLLWAVRLHIWEKADTVDRISPDGVSDHAKVKLQRCGHRLRQERSKQTSLSIAPWHPVLCLRSLYQTPVSASVCCKIPENVQIIFWTCALLEVDKYALQRLPPGMRADSFMA